jgi:adenylate cyclase
VTTGSVGILLGAALLGLVALVGLSSLAFNFFGPRYEGRKRPDSQKFVEHTRDSARLIRYRRVTRRIPTNPRCKICYIPFGGLGRVLRSKPSRLNPNFCASCFESAPLGGYETDVGILFADARGFTAWAAARTPTECAESLNRFYNSATSSLMMHDAVIDKFVGDEVMALFISDMPSMRNDMCDHMMAAAQDLLTAAQESCGELPIGIGLHCGTAWVGNVGSADVRDFTALGEVVNLAARLQACAAPGQIVLSEAVQSRLSSPPESTVAELVVKGSDQAVHARIASPLPAWD